MAGSMSGYVTAPKRIQRKRTKGWRMPEGAVYVGRPGKFGNPFSAYKCECCGYWDVRDDNGVTYLVSHEYVRRPHVRADRSTWTTKSEALREAVRLYAAELTYWVGGRMDWDDAFAQAVFALRGKDLACWCPLDQPCHADVLLEIANRPQPGADRTCTECGEPVDRDGLTTGECGGGGGQKCGECFACSCDGSC